MVRRGDRGNAETRVLLAQALEQKAGVRRAAVVTGDPRDLEGLARATMVPPSWPAPPHYDDLVVVVEADSAAAAVDALSQVDALIAGGRAPAMCGGN